MTSNIAAGVYVTGTDVLVSNNTAKNNQYGIYFYNSYGMIQSNDLIGNQYGVYISNSNATINFNRIIGNSNYGIYNVGNGIINATNNWWGSNNGPIISSISGSDIYITGGTLTYNPWLVLKLTANPVTTNNNSTITADLTHNSAGEDTSSQGNVPDNIPITFVTNLGNMISPGYTRNGKANSTFNRGSYTSGIANITATLDNQTVQTDVIFDEIPLTIIINPVGGFYNTTQNVKLATIFSGISTTFYTLDGSDPRVNGTIYSNPFLLTLQQYLDTLQLTLKVIGAKNTFKLIQ